MKIFKFNSREERLAAVKEDYRLLEFIPNPTQEVIDAAIASDPLAIKFLIEWTKTPLSKKDYVNGLNQESLEFLALHGDHEKLSFNEMLQIAMKKKFKVCFIKSTLNAVVESKDLSKYQITPDTYYRLLKLLSSISATSTFLAYTFNDFSKSADSKLREKAEKIYEEYLILTNTLRGLDYKDYGLILENSFTKNYVLNSQDWLVKRKMICYIVENYDLSTNIEMNNYIYDILETEPCLIEYLPGNMLLDSSKMVSLIERAPEDSVYIFITKHPFCNLPDDIKHAILEK